ncbi:MAG TPA: serine/threonine-protein kinase [Nannocystis sp.]
MDASLSDELAELCTTRRTLSRPDHELFATPPDSLGRYSLLDKLGNGSMGVVYRAFDTRLQRPVAVKVLFPSGKKTAELVSQGDTRLLHEAQAIAQLSHPNIVAVHDVGVVGDRVFLTMEFVEGPTLKQFCEAAPRTWREILPLLIQAGRGIAAAHAGGVIHRDIKPDNILVGHDGRVRVVDFSVARPRERSGETLIGKTRITDTETNMLVGTPAYMAPEQLRAGRADARSDQFAFCVTAYECLLGERPFAGPTLKRLIDNVLAGPPAQPPPFSPQIPRVLYQCIARGLALDPEDRWPDMDTLLAELEKILHRSHRRSVFALAASLGAAAALTLGAALAHYTGLSCSHPELAARIAPQ